MLQLCGNTKIKYETEDSLKGLNSLTHFFLSFVGVRKGPLQSDDKFTAKPSVSSQQVFINAGKPQILHLYCESYSQRRYTAGS